VSIKWPPESANISSGWAAGRPDLPARPCRRDHLYITNEEGHSYVLALGAEYKLLAENEIGETVMATPAISGGALYMRGASTCSPSRQGVKWLHDYGAQCFSTAAIRKRIAHSSAKCWSFAG